MNFEQICLNIWQSILHTMLMRDVVVRSRNTTLTGPPCSLERNVYEFAANLAETSAIAHPYRLLPPHTSETLASSLFFAAAASVVAASPLAASPAALEKRAHIQGLNEYFASIPLLRDKVN